MTNAFILDTLASLESAASFLPGAAGRLWTRWGPRAGRALHQRLARLVPDECLRLHGILTQAAADAHTDAERRSAAQILLGQLPPARLVVSRDLYLRVAGGWVSGLSTEESRLLCAYLQCTAGALPERIALSLYSSPPL